MVFPPIKVCAALEKADGGGRIDPQPAARLGATGKRCGMLAEAFDVVVVGGGNAALCAALAAAESGASVLVLERAPEDESGGNSRFTAGAFRCVYDGVDDLKALMPDLTDGGDRQHRLRHLHRRTSSSTTWAASREYRTDPELCELLVTRSKRHDALDARQGHALRADLRPAGLQDRRQVQVLGRAHGRSRWAAGRAWSTALTKAAREGRHQGRLRSPRRWR